MSYKKNILLVEDDYLDIMNVERILAKMNSPHNLIVTKNGFQALDKLRELKHDITQELPTLILLDINMPQMNGLEFLEVMKKDDDLRLIKVFIITTSNEEGDRLMSRNLGVAGYIVKPLNFEKFEDGKSSLDSFGLMLDLMKM